MPPIITAGIGRIVGSGVIGWDWLYGRDWLGSPGLPALPGSPGTPGTPGIPGSTGSAGIGRDRPGSVGIGWDPSVGIGRDRLGSPPQHPPRPFDVMLMVVVVARSSAVARCVATQTYRLNNGRSLTLHFGSRLRSFELIRSVLQYLSTRSIATYSKMGISITCGESTDKM